MTLPSVCYMVATVTMAQALMTYGLNRTTGEPKQKPHRLVSSSGCATDRATEQETCARLSRLCTKTACGETPVVRFAKSSI